MYPTMDLSLNGNLALIYLSTVLNCFIEFLNKTLATLLLGYLATGANYILLEI